MDEVMFNEYFVTNAQPNEFGESTIYTDEKQIPLIDKIRSALRADRKSDDDIEIPFDGNGGLALRALDEDGVRVPNNVGDYLLGAGTDEHWSVWRDVPGAMVPARTSFAPWVWQPWGDEPAPELIANYYADSNGQTPRDLPMVKYMMAFMVPRVAHTHGTSRSLAPGPRT